MIKAVALTTKDNPYDPFDQFFDWLRYDRDMGHGCCEILDRVSNIAGTFTDGEKVHEYERAIGDIIANDFEHKFKIVRREVEFET